jgi:hypothetical protein
MLRLCYGAPQQQLIQPIITPLPTPSPAPVAAPTPAPAPAPAKTPSVVGFQGPPVNPTRTAQLPGGWNLVIKPGATAPPRVESQSGPSQTQIPTSGTGGLALPPINLGGGQGAQKPSLLDSFDAYLVSRLGPACSDPQCTNVKAKFWQAAVALIYLKAEHSGKFEPGDLLDKMAGFLPGVSA